MPSSVPSMRPASLYAGTTTLSAGRSASGSKGPELNADRGPAYGFGARRGGVWLTTAQKMPDAADRLHELAGSPPA